MTDDQPHGDAEPSSPKPTPRLRLGHWARLRAPQLGGAIILIGVLAVVAQSLGWTHQVWSTLSGTPAPTKTAARCHVRIIEHGFTPIGDYLGQADGKWVPSDRGHQVRSGLIMENGSSQSRV